MSPAELLRLADLHTDVGLAQRASVEAAATFHAAIAKALADGASAAEIAKALGVSRGRVYQWRDKAK